MGDGPPQLDLLTYGKENKPYKKDAYSLPDTARREISGIAPSCAQCSDHRVCSAT